jgi:hydrogenase maturation protease
MPYRLRPAPASGSAPDAPGSDFSEHRAWKEIVRDHEMKTVVLGLGNTLLADDGVGVHAVRALQSAEQWTEDVELLDAGTLSFTLAGAVEQAEGLVVLDAANLNKAPGTVALFEGEAMDDFVANNRKKSVHEVSLFDMLTVARLCDELPARRALIGVQPQHIDWSDEMTDPVRRAIPLVCRAAVDLITRWKS